mmetsp:Transcript_27746/g.73298  ORF Transcript_27746/g.73298 Transcript_27746/m.73298 type:complete len:298 (-) Transcript_27746:201-1094(-)
MEDRHLVLLPVGVELVVRIPPLGCAVPMDALHRSPVDLEIGPPPVSKGVPRPIDAAHNVPEEQDHERLGVEHDDLPQAALDQLRHLLRGIGPRPRGRHVEACVVRGQAERIHAMERAPAREPCHHPVAAVPDSSEGGSVVDVRPNEESRRPVRALALQVCAELVDVAVDDLVGVHVREQGVWRCHQTGEQLQNKEPRVVHHVDGVPLGILRHQRDQIVKPPVQAGDRPQVHHLEEADLVVKVLLEATRVEVHVQGRDPDVDAERVRGAAVADDGVQACQEPEDVLVVGQENHVRLGL